MAKEALKKQIDKSTKTEFDSVIFYTTMTLVFIGIIMVFSASFVQSAFKHNDSCLLYTSDAADDCPLV